MAASFPPRQLEVVPGHRKRQADDSRGYSYRSMVGHCAGAGFKVGSSEAVTVAKVGLRLLEKLQERQNMIRVLHGKKSKVQTGRMTERTQVAETSVVCFKSTLRQERVPGAASPFLGRARQ